MSADRLRQLGLEVREGQGGLEADLSLAGAPLLNPVTRAPVDRATWVLRDGWLVCVAPPAVAGVAAVPLEAVDSAGALALRLRGAFQRYEAELRRRSAQLQALGLSPGVDPESLELRTEVKVGATVYGLAADRLGNFRLVSLHREERSVPLTGEPGFELSEFGDVGALAGYLADLAAEVAPAPTAAHAPAPLVRYGELVSAFGEAALVPPRSPLELLVELEVEGQRYRFAAARVVGRTFRGLLASGRGKVWAERFELDAFPGVVVLVAQVLGVPQEAVRVLRSQEE